MSRLLAVIALSAIAGLVLKQVDTPLWASMIIGGLIGLSSAFGRYLQ